MNKGLYGIPKNRTYEPPLSASYAFTASYVENAVSASYVESSVSSSYPISANSSTIYSTTDVKGGFSNNNSIFLGTGAGNLASNAFASNFIGLQAGSQATNANATNFIGSGAGTNATNADNSNFIGQSAGYAAANASKSTLIGFQAGSNTGAGSIGTNNIIIGTNITLLAGRRDSINLGGILFGSGSYSDTSTNPFSGSANGRIGINVVNPTYSFEVSGTVGFPNLTNSSTATKVVLVDNNGQLFTTASSALGGGGSTTPGDGDQAIQFNSASVFSGSAKLKYDYVNSNVILTGSLLLSQSYISKVDYIDFTPNKYDTVTPGTIPTHIEGRLFYDTGSQTLCMYNNELDVTLNIGQESWLRARNQTGVTITNGSVVKINGAIGNRPSIALAQSTDQVQIFGVDNDIIGMATHDIEQGTDGFVTTFGLVNGVDTSAFNAGDLLWVSQSAGQYTNIPPSAPYDKTFVGIVTRKGNANVGTIFVTPSQPLHFHDISSVSQSGNYTQGDVWMFRQSGSSGVWTNTKTLSGSYTLSGSLTTNDGVSVQTLTASVVSASAITGSLFGTASWASNVASTGIVGNLSQIASGSVTASVTPSQFSVVSGSSTEFTVTGTGVTIGGATTDTHRVTGSLGVTGSLNITGPTTLLPVTNSFAISASGYYVTGSNDSSMVDLRGTWDTSGAPTALNIAIRNTASNNASALLKMFAGTAGTTEVMGFLPSSTINFGSISNNVVLGGAASDNGAGTATTSAIRFGANGGSKTGYDFWFSTNINRTATTGVNNGAFNISTGFAPSTGAAVYNQILAAPTISQSAAATGITRGIFINPTLTSAADFRAIEINSGSLIMNDSYLASGSRSGSLVNLTHLTNTAGNVTSFILNASGSAGASSNIMDLQVAGTSSFTVSRTGAVTINTFASNAAFSYVNSGTTFLTYQPSNNTLAVGSTSARGTITAAVLTLSNSNTSTTAGVISIDNPKSTSTGNVDYITNTSTIAPTSGTSSFNGYTFGATINQTSTAAGITRGLFINPTLTSATDFRAIETTRGRIILSSAQFTGSVSQSSYFTITGSMQQPATTGSQIYATTVAPLITYTAPGQTNTAFRVLPTFTGSTALTASQQNIIADFGASAVGSQFVVNDVTSGSIYQVNDVSGLPIIEATSNWDVNIYDFPNVVFRKTGSNIIISGSLNVTGSVNVATGSLTLTSGSITMPNRPAFRVVGTSSTDIVATTILSGSAASVDYNQGNNYNNTTGLFTAPIAGLYQVFLNARVGSVNSQMQAIVYKNGSTVQFMWEAPGLGASTHFGVSGTVRLAVNDTLQVTVAVGRIQFDGNDSWGVTYIG